MIALILLGFALLAFIQIPALVQKQWWQELICFAFLWSIGLILGIMIFMGIKLPPVSTIISKSISALLGR